MCRKVSEFKTSQHTQARFTVHWLRRSQLHQLVAVFNTLNKQTHARFEAFKAVKIQVEVFRVVTPCGVVIGYQRFKRPRRPRLEINP